MDVGLPDAARFGQLPLATAWEVGISSCGWSTTKECVGSGRY